MTTMTDAMAINVAAFINTEFGSVGAALSSINTKLDALSQKNAVNSLSVNLSMPQLLARTVVMTGRKPKFGMNKETGRLLAGIEHIKQSIADIIHTKIGSRVMRRTYGSNVFALIDAPQNAAYKLGLIATLADALDKHETRFKLARLQIMPNSELENGQSIFNIIGRYNDQIVDFGVRA